MTRPVPDEVWRRLDPRAGALSRRTVLRLWLALGAAVVVFVAGTLVWLSGVVVPRLTWSGLRGWSLHESGVARIMFPLRNAGLFPVTVLEVGRSAPGFKLLRTAGGDLDRTTPSPLPLTLAPGEEAGLVLVYLVSDCDTPPPGSWPVTAQVERPWGVVTVEVRNDRGPLEPWQEQVVDLWCDPQAWSID